MNEDQKILEEMVEDILLNEIKAHGKTREIFKLLDDAVKKGIVRYEERKGKLIIKSNKSDDMYIAHFGEVGVAPVTRFLRKLGYV